MNNDLFAKRPLRIQLDGASGHYEIEISAEAPTVKITDPQGFKILVGPDAQLVALAVQSLLVACAVAR